MIKTTQGLPNTCSKCGNDAGAEWYALNADVARSGGGVCKSCAYPPKQDADNAPDEPTKARGAAKATTKGKSK